MPLRSLCLLLLLPGCVAAPPRFNAPTSDRVVLFIPGYRGSFLREEAGAKRLAWISPVDGLSKGDTSLALDFVGRRDDKRFGPLVEDGPMTRLTAVPLFYSVDSYLPWLEAAKDSGLDFVPFGYDWRRDIRQPAQRLCDTIERLARPGRKIALVGHSMGGLITLRCLRTASPAVRAAVDRVVFVGTPFRGGPGMLDDLSTGTRSASNTALMSVEALFTFTASWQLLPLTGDFFLRGGQPQSVDLQSRDTWLTRGWSVFRDSTLKGDPAYLAQLDALLAARAELWASLADAPQEPFPWKAMAVIGSGRPTTVGWPIDAQGAVDLANPVMGDGDGSVATSRAYPPAPISAIEVQTDAEHSVLLNDRGVQRVVLEFLARP